MYVGGCKWGVGVDNTSSFSSILCNAIYKYIIYILMLILYFFAVDSTKHHKKGWFDHAHKHTNNNNNDK